jgi:hypothetical protein
MVDGNKFKAPFRAGFVLIFIATGTPVLLAQVTSGTIAGVVTDQTGGIIAGSTVTLRHLETNATRTAVTESDGRYTFPGLPVGPYELTVEMPGFARYVRAGIFLLLNQVALVNPELRPAGGTEVVSVTENAPLLNATTAEVGVRFDEKRLTDLPASGQFGRGSGFRDVFSHALSAPGVSQLNSGNIARTAGTNFSVNGSRLYGNNFMIDGQDSNEPSVTGRHQVLNNPDIVQEVRVITNQFLAEHGRNTGSVVSVITKSGTNDLHGSGFWFYNSNALNSLSNLEKAAGFTEAPFINEHQFGGTAGGPIRKDSTFVFGSVQRWTIRSLGSGRTIAGVPTDTGKQIIQQLAGSRPQVQALLRFLPAAQNTRGTPVPLSVGGTSTQIPVGDLTSSTGMGQDNWQGSARIDHNFRKHQLGGRYLFSDLFQFGAGQVTPPGNTQVTTSRPQAALAFLTSYPTSHALNDLRLSYQRLGTTTTASDPSSGAIPALEIAQLGLAEFNASPTRTGIGLAANLPQFRFNNVYQLQDTVSLTHGHHIIKFGVDFRRIEVKTFFIPLTRGRLAYATLQDFVDDVPLAADINKPFPGGTLVQYYKMHDFFFFAQDTWNVRPGLTINYGLRYEAPGNTLASLYDVNDSIVQANGGDQVFRLDPRPGRDLNNFQPRLGFSWNPRAPIGGWLGRLTGGDKLVLRGGYARTHDYTFLNIALNLTSGFPFLGSVSAPAGLPNPYTALPNLPINLTSPAALNMLTRTIVAEDFRSPLSDQFSFEIQRQFLSDTVLRVGYIGTRGTGLFQTIDGNPRTICSPISTNAAGTPLGCPRVDPSRGIIRLRANAASSIYHSMQVSMDKRFSQGFSGGAHYTWSSFIDDASDIFNPSAFGDVAVSQDSFDRRADRGRSTFDRPHRFAANFVYELPFYRSQEGARGRLLGGWQIASFLTFQGGSPFTALNGGDPALALQGISGLVGNAIRPNLATSLDLAGMSVEELYRLRGPVTPAGNALFTTLPPCARMADSNSCVPAGRVGNAGRNILRSDGIGQVDLGILKSMRITESQHLQFRADIFNLSNTRNFGIPDASANSNGFLNQWGTDGGNRRIFGSLRYVF